MTGVVQQIIRGSDAAVARLYLSVFRERNALLAFMFHSLFRDEREMALNQINPLQRTTVAQFRRFVEYFRNCGYRFVSPQDLLDGLPRVGKHILITFDDGYYNNLRAVPILEEFGVPATFFITTDNVQHNRCFWWDVIYRQRIAEGVSEPQVLNETRSLKIHRTEEIERRLTEQFGPDAFTPRGEVDRPFLPDELRDFARNPLVHLGNHTSHHGILTNYTPAEVRDQLSRAQSALRDITAVEAIAVAYPNGNYNDDVLAACREIGLKIGFTVRPRKNDLPRADRALDLLCLNRFATHNDNGAYPDITTLCRTYRSDFQMYGKFRELYLRFNNKRAAY